MGRVENFRAELAKERERLVVPAAPHLVAKLALRYSSPALGELTVVRDAGATTFDFGDWKSKVASRKNDDGTVSFITTDSTNVGFELSWLINPENGLWSIATANRIRLRRALSVECLRASPLLFPETAQLAIS